MNVIDRVVLAKFRTRSQTWIEVHVADNNEQETLYRESGKPLWSIYADAEEQQAVVDGLIARCLNIAEQARTLYPEAYAAAVRPDPALVSEDYRPIQANPNIREEEFWGWMFAPNVYFRVKSFGLWALQPNFLAKFLEPTEKAFVEEHQGAFACSMAQHTFAMLADGQFTPCCLDYDGEIDFGNIGDKTVSQAFWSIERTALLADSSVHPSCRRCKGRAYIFETAPPASDRGRVEMYGRGWHGWEPGLSGRGGRWSDGNGHFYLYGRAPVAGLSLDLFSTFPAGTELRLRVWRADDSLQSFAPAGEHAFTAAPHAISTVDLPLDLPAGAFYRFELITPTFRPSDVQESRDHRRLGVAVFAIEAAFTLDAADRSAPALEATAV
jgi:radical SAM protein with 4Fe4S-binding SPASM domain